MKPGPQPIRSAPAVCLLLLATATLAAPVQLQRQSIELPASAGPPLFVDVAGEGRCNLLVIDRVQNRLLHFHHRANGFSPTPDQTIDLPPQTAWIAPFDVDPNPGLELVFSTPDHLVYSRQNQGLFESERRSLMEAAQVFTNSKTPRLTLLTTNQEKPTLAAPLPVIEKEQVIPFHRDASYHWRPGAALPLTLQRTAWEIEPDSSLWKMGRHAAQTMSVRKTLRVRPEDEPLDFENNPAITNLLNQMNKAATHLPHGTNFIDLDGDGRKDLVLWQVSGMIEFKTDVYVFLRNAAGRLPAQPTQIVRGRGFPIPRSGTEDKPAPVSDLNGDGVCELALVEPRIGFASPSAILEAILSHGLDWSLTIRPFHHGSFATNPVVSVPVTAVLPLDDLRDWPLFIHGDFNGDGHPDFVVRRSETQWFVFPSAPNGKWFAPQPWFTFDTPPHGYPEPIDLNGDGLADIVWHEPNSSRLTIFITPSVRPAPNNPKP